MRSTSLTLAFCLRLLVHYKQEVALLAQAATLEDSTLGVQKRRRSSAHREQRALHVLTRGNHWD